MKFICDDNLGRLARWLRTLGYDTAWESNLTDNRVLTLALQQGRLIITRDAQLAAKTLAREVILLTTTDPFRQLQELFSRVDLRPEKQRLFTICPLCNMVVSPVAKEKFADQIPPYVYRTKDRFTRCPSCGRIFWPGTHVERMREKLAAAGLLIS